MIVEADEPASGSVSSRAARITRSLSSAVPVRSRRRMCSTVTIVSSITSPTAAAAPPSVIMLRLIPRMESNRPVIASTAGTTRMPMAVTRQLRRKAKSTTAARPTPDCDCITHAGDRVGYQDALVVPRPDLRPFRDRTRDRPKLSLEVLSDLDCVGARLLVDGHENRRVTVGRDALVLGRVCNANRGNVLEFNDAVAAALEHRVHGLRRSAGG